jgi:polysaccharide export outer membrane protein
MICCPTSWPIGSRPGDAVTVGIFELFRLGEWSTSTRRVDAGGYLRVQEIGEIMAAGLTAQQLEDRIADQLMQKVTTRRPQVDVVIEQAGAFRYSIYGYVQNAGLFTLQNPDLHLIEALSLAGGVPISTERVYVIRQVTLSDEYRPIYDRNQEQPASMPGSNGPGSTSRPAANIDDLLKQLDQKPQTPSPGMLQSQDPPPVDIDELQPVHTNVQQPPVDVDTFNRNPSQATQPEDEDQWIFVPERNEWVRMRQSARPAAATRPGGGQSQGAAPAQSQMVLERVIEVDYERLARGDSSQNIVVRPGDRIFVEGPANGYVYFDGEVSRPGVYNMPNQGTLTLSRLIAAAGGLNALAIPERVDMTRKVGRNREATVRLDLAAIRRRTEPDIVLKPDDSIIIGTSWAATPLAIIRNGFRATYGFGLVLDRNFGNDVFGAEPVNAFGN